PVITPYSGLKGERATTRTRQLLSKNSTTTHASVHAMYMLCICYVHGIAQRRTSAEENTNRR
ncbi:hypothetical protein, partial [Butyricimonas sp. An62]|uniref:hypothetical protein n=1 Tax=Butyricimonas sp. An62 TaxID=1965649 RepID=UPI0030811341